MKSTNLNKTMAALALALMTLTSATAFAQSSAPANTSEANAKDWKKNIKVTLSVDYYGQAVNDLGTMAQPDIASGARDMTSPSYFEPALIAGYKVGETTIGGAAALDYRPTLLDFKSQKAVTWLDPQLRATNGNIYTKGNFSLGTQMRVYLGVTEGSIKKNMLTNLRWYQFYSLEVPGSRWSVSAVTYLRQYIYGDSAVAGTPRKTFEFYAGPQVNYQVTQNTRLWLLFEYTGTQFNSTSFFSLRRPDDADRGPGTDAEFGATWDINSKLSLTPYIDVKTADRVALDTTTINANLTYRPL